jgi:hypothetical protein
MTSKLGVVSRLHLSIFAFFASTPNASYPATPAITASGIRTKARRPLGRETSLAVRKHEVI